MAEKEKKNRDKWLHLRLTEHEYQQLQEQFKRSTEKKLSRYARKVFLAQPIHIIHRNGSLDELITVLIRVQNDLNGVTNNYNQMIHKLHMADNLQQLRAWVNHYEKEKEKLFATIEQIKNVISEGAKLWLR